MAHGEKCHTVRAAELTARAQLLCDDLTYIFCGSYFQVAYSEL